MKFNSELLEFTGSTDGLGIDNDNGIKIWTSILEVIDHKGESAEIKLNFQVQRQVSDLIIQKVNNDEAINRREKNEIKLRDLVEIKINENKYETTILDIVIEDKEKEMYMYSKNKNVVFKEMGLNSWRMEITEGVKRDIM